MVGALTVVVYQPSFDRFILSSGEVHVPCEPFCAVAFLYTPSLDPCQNLELFSTKRPHASFAVQMMPLFRVLLLVMDWINPCLSVSSVQPWDRKSSLISSGLHLLALASIEPKKASSCSASFHVRALYSVVVANLPVVVYSSIFKRSVPSASFSCLISRVMLARLILLRVNHPIPCNFRISSESSLRVLF